MGVTHCWLALSAQTARRPVAPRPPPRWQGRHSARRRPRCSARARGGAGTEGAWGPARARVGVTHRWRALSAQTLHGAEWRLVHRHGGKVDTRRDAALDAWPEPEAALALRERGPGARVRGRYAPLARPERANPARRRVAPRPPPRWQGRHSARRRPRCPARARGGAGTEGAWGPARACVGVTHRWRALSAQTVRGAEWRLVHRHGGKVDTRRDAALDARPEPEAALALRERRARRGRAWALGTVGAP